MQTSLQVSLSKAAVAQVEIPIMFNSGMTGVLTISVLPRDERKDEHLLHWRADPPPLGTAAVQLLEGSEYRYEISLGERTSAETNRPEIFQPDSKHGLTGRIRTAQYTGSLTVRVSTPTDLSNPIELEVRSSKLHYLTDYRWMLRDLSDEVTEIILNAFGPTEQKLGVAQNTDPVTLYHRFCFLRGLIETERFQESIVRILASPYRSWESEQLERNVGAGIQSSSVVARQIARGGNRRETPSTRFPTLPVRINMDRSEETLDNLPNRFVKAVFMRWRAEVHHIVGILENEKPTPSIKRGLQEANALIVYLDETLSAPLFREVGTLNRGIGANQVLQRREGYREVLIAVLQSELASQLSWDGGEDVFEAGQRNVAALYEYWVFLKLSKLVSKICDVPLSFASLFTSTAHGLRLGLRRGCANVLQGQISRHGRMIEVMMFFNKTFEAARDSWSRDMRPDYSVKLTPRGPDSSWLTPVLLHFDAKYRINQVEELFGPDPDADKESDVKRTDLLKMHAYKDAIRRSSGAYVIYPGELDAPLTEYEEVLPGIGAFCLKPSEDGDGNGISQIAKFLNDVVDHLATQLTQDERHRYWRSKVRSESTGTVKARVASFLGAPPLDTVVLIGPIRSREEADWIRTHKRYVVPVDPRTGSTGLSGYEIAADLIMLHDSLADFATIWSVVGAPVIADNSHLAELRYPHVESSNYVVLNIETVTDEYWNSRIPSTAVGGILPKPPRVVASTWARVVEEFYRMGIEL